MKKKTLQEILNPIEPEVPADIAVFLETDFGQRVKEYFISEAEFIVTNGYREAHDMVLEERRKVKDLQKQLDNLLNGGDKIE